MTDETDIPFVLRIILAPFGWPKLLLGARFSALENQVLQAVVRAVPAEQRDRLTKQLGEVNYVGRSSVSKTEVVLTRRTAFGVARTANPLPFTEPEKNLAVIDLIFDSGERAKADIWVVAGALAIIEFDRKVDLRKAAKSIVCRVL